MALILTHSREPSCRCVRGIWTTDLCAPRPSDESASMETGLGDGSQLPRKTAHHTRHTPDMLPGAWRGHTEQHVHAEQVLAGASQGCDRCAKCEESNVSRAPTPLR